MLCTAFVGIQKIYCFQMKKKKSGKAYDERLKDSLEILTKTRLYLLPFGPFRLHSFY